MSLIASRRDVELEKQGLQLWLEHFIVRSCLGLPVTKTDQRGTSGTSVRRRGILWIVRGSQPILVPSHYVVKFCQVPFVSSRFAEHPLSHPADSFSHLEGTVGPLASTAVRFLFSASGLCTKVYPPHVSYPNA